MKSTKSDVALRLHELGRLKDIVGEIQEKISRLAEAQVSWSGSDHFDQEGAMACWKRNPFGD